MWGGGNPITAIIADDHPLVRNALRRSLTARGLVVVGEAESGEEAIRLVETLSPRVAVLDLAMGSVDGFEATRRIALARPLTKVFIYSGANEAGARQRALSAGAAAYVSKTEVASALLEAIAELMQFRPPTRLAALSPRERQVVALVCDDYDHSQIAAWLGISPHTVDVHRKKAMRKLGVPVQGWIRAAGVRRHANPAQVRHAEPLTSAARAGAWT